MGADGKDLKRLTRTIKRSHLHPDVVSQMDKRLRMRASDEWFPLDVIRFT